LLWQVRQKDGFRIVLAWPRQGLKAGVRYPPHLPAVVVFKVRLAGAAYRPALSGSDFD